MIFFDLSGPVLPSCLLRRRRPLLRPSFKTCKPCLRSGQNVKQAIRQDRPQRQNDPPEFGLNWWVSMPQVSGFSHRDSRDVPPIVVLRPCPNMFDNIVFETPGCPLPP